MSLAGAEILLTELLPELTQLENDAERQEFLSRNPMLVRAEVVQELAPLVVKKIRLDAREALRLAEGAVLIAQTLGEQKSVALALRAKANALFACRENRAAMGLHDEAYHIYAAQELWKDAAITLNSAIQPLILLGEYERAFAASNRAREIFTRLGEGKRLANLENNVGNIFHRQDRLDEALAHYERAYNALAEYGEWEDSAVALHNMAMCLVGLNDFPRSMDCYHKARQLCVKYNMPRLRDQADYNIAYLYYFRGEYSRAIEMLLATKRACEQSGDEYRLALCDLDLSEIYLELNLSEEAREIAREGFLRFEKLGIAYDAAKALANEAIAYGQQGRAPEAIERFEKARGMFASEQNLVWSSLLDLYQGVLLFHQGQFSEAQQLGAAAAKFFDQSVLLGKAVLAHLLLTRIAMQAGDLDQAERQAEAASEKMSVVHTPELIYQTHFLLGAIASGRGNRSAARAEYQQARRALETLRTHLHRDELKISFVKNRLQVYEELVNLHINTQGAELAANEALACMEAAKSRSMTAMIFRTGRRLPCGDAGQSREALKIRDLREELNWYYHRIELEQLRPEEISHQRIERLQRKAQERENELLRALRELPAHERENVGLEEPSQFSVTNLQNVLPTDTALIEYYAAGDRLVAAVVTRETIEITTVAAVSQVTRLLQLLRFQISKFSMGTAHTQPFEQALLRTTVGHLEALYAELMRPLRSRLREQRLVIVPHGPLHFLPFHALRNGDEYLGDAYTVSYAPSAAVFALCQQMAVAEKRGSLVLGIPDDRAPQIVTEARSVAALLPEAKLYLGEQATANILIERGPETALLHIATHGIYRGDNPMFSGIRLGDGYLNLYDLYQLRLNAKLVTLSGCATGMNFVAAGDELLGLQRGLFYAGATTLLLSLWDVHDRSTAELMQEFYRRYIQNGDAAVSLRGAMRILRRENPHPYFWAPFVLVGKITTKTID